MNNHSWISVRCSNIPHTDVSRTATGILPHLRTPKIRFSAHSGSLPITKNDIFCPIASIVNCRKTDIIAATEGVIEDGGKET